MDFGDFKPIPIRLLDEYFSTHLITSSTVSNWIDSNLNSQLAGATKQITQMWSEINGANRLNKHWSSDTRQPN